MFYVEDDYKPSLKNRWNSQIRPSFFVCDFLNFADVFFWQKKHLERNTVIIQHGGFFENKQIVWGQKYGKFKFPFEKKTGAILFGAKKRQQIQSHNINSPTFCRWLDVFWKQKPHLSDLFHQ